MYCLGIKTISFYILSFRLLSTENLRYRVTLLNSIGENQFLNKSKTIDKDINETLVTGKLIREVSEFLVALGSCAVTDRHVGREGTTRTIDLPSPGKIVNQTWLSDS